MSLVKRHYTDEETLITAKNLNDIQDAILDLEDGLFTVDNGGKGVAVTITEAARRGLRGLRIYGKTTQDGTPTPEAPVDLVSSVDGDSISVHVCGKNLFTGWEVGGISSGDGSDATGDTKRRTGYLPVFTPGQRIAISGIPDTLYNLVVFYDANKAFINRSTAGNYTQRFVDVPANAKYFRLTIYESTSTSGKIAEAEAMANLTMIEAGNAYTEYEQSKLIQTADISTPNGLKGIPVGSGGNYIDASGQQWICDEIDFTRGKYIQRIGKSVIDVRSLATLANGLPGGVCIFPGKKAIQGATFMCSNAQAKAYSSGIGDGQAYQNAANVVFVGTADDTLATLQSKYNGGTVLYILATPVETDLTEADFAAYTALHTHKERTMVSNNGHAYMELEYVMDAKKYIDKIAGSGGSGGGGGSSARLSTVTLRSSAWVGTDSPYSQVVTIDGITEYSKVDLLPSVEQLAIFHNKDVAFVTENEDGVVTVFAIGDKPTQDYTMQVSIAEGVA